ncbi:MAG: DUF4097 family beta strand repeat protein [Microbacteriaceae bacterium]|nr:DUF4097 family beta strand repeat protein [Microbacteriaceae bacterium]
MEAEKWLVDKEKTIEVEGVRKLKIALIRGKVDVIGHDEPTTRVEIRSVRGKALKITLDGDSLEIDHPQIRWDDFLDVFSTFKGSASADVSILVPKDVALSLNVVSADGLVSGITEDARVNTVSGDIVIDGLYGDLDLGTVSGEITIRNHYGNVAAKSVSGDLTASGEIMELVSRGVSGDVFVDLKGIPDKVNIKSVSGSITARFEPEVPAQYKVSMLSGRLQLDDSEIVGVRGSYSGKYGELDRRWVEFTANTVSGNVSVMHLKPSEK